MVDQGTNFGDRSGVSVNEHNWVTNIIVRFFCRRDDRRIAYSLYRYFRECDDYIDDPVRSRNDKLNFLSKQRRLIEHMYNGHAHNNSQLASIIDYDRAHQNAFKDVFDEMLDVFEFDARRGGNHCDINSLTKYSLMLSRAYTTLLIMFLKPQHEVSEQDIQLAHGCHLIHMLRDYYEDQRLGYLNIPEEERNNFSFDDPASDNFRQWVKNQVALVETKLKKSKKALRRTYYIRVQLIALLYCFRYETVLRQLKDNGYILKSNYPLRIKDAGCLVKTLVSILFHGLASKFAIV